MRAALSTIDVVRPRDLGQALRALADGGARPTPIAGGTDLLVYLNAGAHTGTRFLDLWGLAELRGIKVARDGVRLGALATFSQIREHAWIARELPMLAAAAAEVGARQIQNRATVAGNVANASPAGDSLPALLALDAVVHARSLRGARDLPFDGLYTGYRKLALAPDELIEAVSIAKPPRGTAQFFRKVGTRRAQSISKVVMAGRLTRGRGGAMKDVRIALGSVAPVTMRARRAEAVLEGARPTPEVVARARAALLDEIAPIDDIRSDRFYRLDIAGNLLEQFLRTAHPPRGG